MFNILINHIFKNAKSCLFALICAFVFLNAFNANVAKANVQNLSSNLKLHNPSSVQLTHAGARINIEIQAIVNRQNNHASIIFAIPHEAQDLTISINNASVPRWSSSNNELKKLEGKASLKYSNLIAEKHKIEGQMRALNASLSLWLTPPNTDLPLNDLRERQNELEKIIPNLEIKLAQTKQHYEKINIQLSEFPKISRRIKVINAFVPDNLTTTKTVKVNYSYSLNNCGWLAQYQFNALPEKDIVQVSLFAKIWQYSGLDWKNTQIILLPLNSKNIVPYQLDPWYISSQESNRIYKRNAAPQAMMLNAYASPESVVNAPTIQENIAFTGWSLNKYNIDEGEVEIRLNEAQWDSKMLWLARPAISSNVWLTVKHTLANTSAWPAGKATFLIDNALIGNGSFTPIGDEASIYFGVDPRLNVKSVASMRIMGKEGFIDKTKTWDWAWDYTIYNGRKSPAKVRVEEPEPQLGNEDFTVKYNSKPKPQQDEDHTLFWDITVPAEKSITIKHAVTISAPSELNVNTGR